MHPRTDAARTDDRRHPAREIAEHTEIGSAYMASLIRTQRRSALAMCVVVAAMLFATALAGALTPRYSTLRLFGIAVPWLVLGIVVYPVLIGIGWYTARVAERHERDFASLVRRR